MRTTTTITNSFHGRSVVVRKSPEELEKILQVLATGTGDELRAARRFAARCKSRLGCPAGCTCSDSLGRR